MARFMSLGTGNGRNNSTAASSYSSWHDSFTYHGFRFVQVVGSNFWAPTVNDIEAHVVYSSVDAIGDIQFFSGSAHQPLL